MNENEVWKTIKNHPNYEVSSFGRIKSYKSNILKGEVHPDGYIRIEFSGYRCKKKKRIRVFIHRLVLEAFVGPCPSNNHEPNHKDGIKNNNHLSNLEWVTHGENQAHAYTLGLRYSKGEFHSQAKLKEVDVKEIRRLVKHGICQSTVAKNFNTSPQNIQRIIKYKTWKHI